MNQLEDYAAELLAWTGCAALVGASAYALWRFAVALKTWIGG
mgnify:CR=1 FL=1